MNLHHHKPPPLKHENHSHHQPPADYHPALTAQHQDWLTKLPWDKWFHSAWRNDPKLSKCCPASRGIWMDLLGAMHDEGREGRLCGTAEELSRLARCSPAEIVQALTELQRTETANVTDRNGIFTVINRRMMREYKSRSSNALRQQRFRERHSSNGDVTPETNKRLEVRDQRIDIKRLNDAKSGVNGHPEPCTDDATFNRSSSNRHQEAALMQRLRETLGEEEMARAGGHWRKDHVRKHPMLLERGLNEIDLMVKEGKSFTSSRAACLEDLLKRWS